MPSRDVDYDIEILQQAMQTELRLYLSSRMRELNKPSTADIGVVQLSCKKHWDNIQALYRQVQKLEDIKRKMEETSV